MPNPLSVITPALELLGKNVNILPAMGNAVEDLQHPDQDEIDDVLVNLCRDSRTINSQYLQSNTPIATH